MAKRKINTAAAVCDREKYENSVWQYQSAPEQSELLRGSKSVVICVPERLEDVQRVIDIIKNHQPLIMDLSGISGHIACRILDFMSGAVYALSGSMQNYKGSFYLVTPFGCDIKQLQR